MSSGMLLIIGIVALLLGIAMFAGWFDWVLRVGGIILIVVGIVAIVVGVVGMFNRGNTGSGRF